MTVNKQQKAKIIIQLFICTTIKLQSWGDFFSFFFYTKSRGMKREREINVRSGEPVQNIIRLICGYVLTKIFLLSYIYMKKLSHTHTSIQTFFLRTNSKYNFSTA